MTATKEGWPYNSAEVASFLRTQLRGDEILDETAMDAVFAALAERYRRRGSSSNVVKVTDKQSRLRKCAAMT
jgi:outer membrane protein assembly factor BamA